MLVINLTAEKEAVLVSLTTDNGTIINDSIPRLCNHAANDSENLDVPAVIVNCAINHPVNLGRCSGGYMYVTDDHSVYIGGAIRINTYIADEHAMESKD